MFTLPNCMNGNRVLVLVGLHPSMLNANGHNKLIGHSSPQQIMREQPQNRRRRNSHTLTPPLSLLTMRVARASLSTSSATINNGLWSCKINRLSVVLRNKNMSWNMWQLYECSSGRACNYLPWRQAQALEGLIEDCWSSSRESESRDSLVPVESKHPHINNATYNDTYRNKEGRTEPTPETFW